MSRLTKTIAGLKFFQFLAWIIFTAMAAYELDAVWKVLAFMMIVWAISSINGLKTLAEIRSSVEEVLFADKKRVKSS
jgi:hypothetical protein